MFEGILQLLIVFFFVFFFSAMIALSSDIGGLFPKLLDNIKNKFKGGKNYKFIPTDYIKTSLKVAFAIIFCCLLVFAGVAVEKFRNSLDVNKIEIKDGEVIK